MAVIAVIALGIGACGGSSGKSSSPVPAPGPIRPGTVFLPVMPPLSPNDVWHGSAVPSNAGAAATPQPFVLDHWFFLVNGALSNNNSLPTGIGAPAPSSTPWAMTVTGVGDGIPAPNGSLGVTNLQLNPNMTGKQLWKAVTAPNDNIYLRSAESFKVNEFAPRSGNPPSMLVGYGGNGVQDALTSGTPVVPLDLGYDPAAGGGALAGQNPNGVAIYMNQEYQPSYGFGPTTDGSQFQQWNYNTANAQLTNANGGQIYSIAGQSAYGIGTGSSAPGNQWYVYPNYYLETVVNAPNSSPPFPPAGSNSSTGTDAPGERAAYDYISGALLGTTGAGQQCAYEGTSYSGIRCQYANLAATATLTTCESAVPLYSNPGSYQGTAISTADWQAVQSQIGAECRYAADVQDAFTQYNIFLTQIFTQEGDAIAGIVSDVGVPSSQTVNPIPAEILEGIVYTVLSAVGGPVGGVIANVISTATNVAITANGQTQLTHPLAMTVADLYTTLGTTFQSVSGGLNSAETAILEDWGRLQQIGPATEYDGYNGLGMTPTDVTNAENEALKGYKLTVLQTLLAAGVSDYVQGLPGAFGGYTTASNGYNYPAYGPASPATTAMFMNVIPGKPLDNGDYPSATSTAVINDITGNGGNQFEAFNGINGWSGLPLLALFTYPLTSGGTNTIAYYTPSCYVTFGTIFNYTARNLSITFSTPDFSDQLNDYVEISGPNGYAVASYSAQLPAYGYAPVYTLEALDGSKQSATFDVSVYDSNVSTSNPVAAFPFVTNGACGSLSVPSYSWNSGYAWAQTNFNQQSVISPGKAPSPGGVWGTLVNVNP